MTIDRGSQDDDSNEMIVLGKNGDPCEMSGGSGSSSSHHNRDTTDTYDLRNNNTTLNANEEINRER